MTKRKYRKKRLKRWLRKREWATNPYRRIRRLNETLRKYELPEPEREEKWYEKKGVLAILVPVILGVASGTAGWWLYQIMTILSDLIREGGL